MAIAALRFTRSWWTRRERVVTVAVTERLAIYPGSFDPITMGHVDVAQRAARLFDRLIVAVYAGGEKEGGLFSIEERMVLARAALGDGERGNIVVDSFTGLTVEYARARGAGT